MNCLATQTAITLATAATCAGASVTFNYESLPLKSEDIYPPAGAWPALTVSLEFSDDGDELLAWKFEQANVGVVSGIGYRDDVKWLSIHTDSKGIVSKWSLAVVNSSGDQQLVFATYHDEVFDLPSPGYSRDGAQKYIWGDNPQRATFGIDASGTWSSTVAMPNLNFVLPVPEPSTPLMFTAGAVWLTGLLLRRRTRSASLS